MNVPRLMVVADRAARAGRDEWIALVVSLVRAAEQAGPDVAVQVRSKPRLDERDARALGQVAPRAILNGTAADARRWGFGGVHRPEADVLAAREERDRGTDLLVTASVHSLDAARAAAAAGARAVVFGPVFRPLSKPGRARGLDALAEVAAAAGVPVLAIGGVTPDRVADCLDAGAYGVAVLGGILFRDDPPRAVARYAESLERACAGAALSSDPTTGGPR